MKTQKLLLFAALITTLVTGSERASAVAPALGFNGISAGEPTQDSALFWTRVSGAGSNPVALTLQLSSNPECQSQNGPWPPAAIITSVLTNTTPALDSTAKVLLGNLQSDTAYYYRWVMGSTNLVYSPIGTVRTAPPANAAKNVRFGFSGDADGQWRPYPVVADLPTQFLDFFINLGDTMYEDKSIFSTNCHLTGTIPPSTNGATAAQLKVDYSGKYNENYAPVGRGTNDGQASLQPMALGQGVYTLYDNHEMGDLQYQCGGAPAGGPVGGMASGAGVNPTNPINDINVNGPFINKTPGFGILLTNYICHQPVIVRTNAVPGSYDVTTDPRSSNVPVLFYSQQWGSNVMIFNVNDRSYRDIDLQKIDTTYKPKKASDPKEKLTDDTGLRADNTNRTMLGAAQFGWLTNALMSAQQAGIPWKFVAISTPIDQQTPIGGKLPEPIPNPWGGYKMPQDKNKSWMGGYRSERNRLLKFIAENGIKNVVFLSTDDHQNRITRLAYSTNGQTGVQSTYATVPACFEIVAGPYGASGPNFCTIRKFEEIKSLADYIANAQTTNGIVPIGLQGYPGLSNVYREGDTNSLTAPSSVDFFSPNTFNYNVLDVSADGSTLTVTSRGIWPTAADSGQGVHATNAIRQILTFQVQAER